METCALLGDKPVRPVPIPWANTMGSEEANAVNEVMASGILSAFIANSGGGFLGGEKIQELECAFCERFRTKHAIAVNSATTGLHTAIAACGIGPGDEVIVSPYTMVATATAILMNGAVPIFADIDPETYTLDPTKLERWISPHTKGILTVNIFGLPSNLPAIMEIAHRHSLYVIEDNAQAPGATINGVEAGTIADIGVFSLNYHKVIHSGEGGILMTNDEVLARKCQLIRNHGEVSLDEERDMDTYVIGSNYRMSELHAAIGIEQLKKLDGFLDMRRKLADKITHELSLRPGLDGVCIPEGFTHSYYVYPIRFDESIWGISRHTFAKAMKAEGFPLGEGYVKPIYLMNLYRHKHAYNNTTYPFDLIKPATQEYVEGICPITERMYNRELLIADICRIPYTEKDIDDFMAAIDRIWACREKL